MNYIIFDLELNCRMYKSKLPMEIIELGAVKLNEQLTEVDRFQAFVKPRLLVKLAPTIKRKTKIEQVDINNAESLAQVLEQFQSFIGDEYTLIAWGPDDLRHLRTNCEFNKLDIEWIENYFDLQKAYMTLRKLPSQPALKNVLAELDLEEYGNYHRGLDDALNTAKVFRKIFGEIIEKLP